MEHLNDASHPLQHESRRDDLVDRIATVRDGETTTVERLEGTLARIEAVDGALNAFHEVLSDDARRHAASIDRQFAEGRDPGPLAGAIVAVKDNLCTTEGRTTCSSTCCHHFLL